MKIPRPISFSCDYFQVRTFTSTESYKADVMKLIMMQNTDIVRDSDKSSTYNSTQIEVSSCLSFFKTTESF